MKARSALLSLAIAASLAACAGAERGADAPSDAPGDSLVRLMENLAGDVEAAGERCGEFAERVATWVDRERESVDALRADLEERVGEMTEAEIERLDERLTSAIEVVVHRASECEDSAAAQQALADFDSVIEGS